MVFLVPIIYLLLFIIWGMGLYAAITRKFSSFTTKVVWIILIVFVPISVVIFYFIMQKISKHPKDVRWHYGYLTLELRTKTKEEALNIIEELRNIPKNLIETKMKEIALRNVEDYEFIDGREKEDTATYWNEETRIGSTWINTISNVNIGEIAPKPAEYSGNYFVMFLLDKKNNDFNK